jgi:peptide-methionine (S)-S-oxide reductase
MTDYLKQATLAAGCFWCVETIFRQLKGVKKVISGYAGGMVKNPTYQQVCSGNTGHAEAIQITYNPAIITYPEILNIFWRIHDPTTLNRQGGDIGAQYRSVIFFHDLEQQEMAEKSRAEMAASGLWSEPIVTEIVAFTNFYPAEEYHQNYFNRNPQQGYCQTVINPKIHKFRKDFSSFLKNKDSAT